MLAVVIVVIHWVFATSDFVLSMLHSLSHLIFTITPWSRYYCTPFYKWENQGSERRSNYPWAWFWHSGLYTASRLLRGAYMFRHHNIPLPNLYASALWAAHFSRSVHGFVWLCSSWFHTYWAALMNQLPWFFLGSWWWWLGTVPHHSWDYSSPVPGTLWLWAPKTFTYQGSRFWVAHPSSLCSRLGRAALWSCLQDWSVWKSSLSGTLFSFWQMCV